MIEYNTIYSNECGIALRDVSSNNITGNNISSNIGDGISFLDTTYNIITHNNITSNMGKGIDFSSQSDNNLIKNNRINLNNEQGIYFKASPRYNEIIDNEIWNNTNDGIYFSSSADRNIIKNNTVWDHRDGGIHIYVSTENIISGNNFSHNGMGVWSFKASNNDYMNNSFFNNGHGIFINNNPSNDNTISNNSFIANIASGIFIDSDNFNNVIFHNKFIGNSIHADDKTNKGNQWDNGYPSGGNFWDNYAGIDNYHGPNQDLPGFDGFGDTPYIIDSNSRDNYPLMRPIEEIGPRIQLINPDNNSIIKPGTILDFDVYDEDLDVSNYTLDGGFEQSFSSPYNISTAGWFDGAHTVMINATDINNNSVSRNYLFTIDSIKPEIILNSPLNNSIILNGTILNYTITDLHLNETHFSINGGMNNALSDPFDISTLGWPDGNYTIRISAMDLAGNSNSSWFFFIIDTAPPIIILNAPQNNSVIVNGTILDFSIVEVNLVDANYSVNGGPNISFPEPFDIPSSGWPDGDYTIIVNALDIAGNFTTSWYFFIIDSVKPEILLNSPMNNSVIPGDTILDFSVTDLHLMNASYSVNGGVSIPLFDPFDISSTGWIDGNYTILIEAIDEAGNSNSSRYFFTLDSTPPMIILNSPDNNSAFGNNTVLDFEIVDPHLLQANYSINGDSIVVFTAPFDINTSNWTDGSHTVQIDAIDAVGNSITSWFIFEVDTIKSTINLNSPDNNSLIPGDTLLNFSIYDKNLLYVNYSINGGATVSLFDPFNILTTGWVDGFYEILVNAIDLAGNSNSSLYSFTVDSTEPTISLNNPINNSFIFPGAVLDFTVFDVHLAQVNYSINGLSSDPLLAPFNISTTGWTDDDYIIKINALDLAGNSNTMWFFFSIDTTKPVILLDSPDNNSFISSGTLLNFSVIESNLLHTNYSINGGINISFLNPFDIPTIGWIDGDYSIQINVIDLAGNSNSSSYYFTIDSIKPVISLNNPGNNSVIHNGITLDIMVFDTHLVQANYSVNGGRDNPFSSPFNISTTGWLDNNYTLKINTMDLAGNLNSSWFFFTVDSTPPTIWLDNAINHSIFTVGTHIQINISDPHLDSVLYSLDGTEYNTLEELYLLNSSNWLDGLHTITIKANDTAGNEAIIWFEVTIDAIPPEVKFSYIESSKDFSANVVVRTINLTFSELMNQTNTEDYISISLPVEFDYHWDTTGTTLFVTFVYDISPEPYTYDIIINSEITDINGTPMGSQYAKSWMYLPDTDNDGLPDTLDNDDDNDGWDDENDTFPTDTKEWMDTDSDGVGNNADLDDDADGVPDNKDDFPLDPNRWEEPQEGDFILYILIIILIVVVSLILVMLFFKRKKRQSELLGNNTVKDETELHPQNIEKEEPSPPKATKPLPPPPPPPK